jgi:uncharacterized protein YbaP (TraB family)
MRKYNTWIFFLLFLVNQHTHADSVSALVTPEKFTKGLIWKIEAAQKSPSYLMGTIHVDDPRVRELFKNAQGHFNDAKTVCTEVKLDFKAIAAELQAMFFSDGQTLESVITDKALYQQTIKLAKERGLPEIMIRQMKPFALVFVLSMPPSTGQILDEKIYTDAIRQGKQVCGLETVEEHGDIFKSFGMSDQIKMLKITVENIAEVDKQYPLLLKAYLERDLAAMAALMNASMLIHDKEIEALFIQRFLIDRNNKMLMRMQPLIEKGNAFFAVGAMHLTGKAGLLRLLEAQGYRLSVVY